MDILLCVGQALFSVWSFSLFLWVLTGWPYEPLEEWIRMKLGEEVEEAEENTNVITFRKVA